MKGPQFNESDVAKDILKPRLKKGTYLFRVTSAGVKDEASDSFTGKVNEKGNYVVGLRLAPVDGNGDTKSPGANLSLVGPFRTDPDDLAAAGLPADAQKKVPNTMFIIERYAQSRSNAKTPYPIPEIQKLKKVAGKWQVVDAKGVPTGEALEPKAEREAKLKEKATTVREFYQAIFSNASLLVGDEFYGEVDYKPESGFDGPQIEICENQDPSVLDLVDTTQSIEELPETAG